MNHLLEQVGRAIRERGLFHRGQRLLAAVSGGVDSMVLLHVLHRLSKRNNWQLIVAHLNHKLRGRSSDADEQLVHQVTRQLQLRLVSEHVDVRTFAREQKISIEMAARDLRHDFLARTAERLEIPTVVLAHHADDQLELFFLRLLRGSGGEGLSGMRWRNASPADPRIELVRPLLGVGKVDLKKFAREQRVPFREDKTNADVKIQRNRIRHELLPLLRRKYQPALAATISRVMEIVGAESEFAGQTARDWLAGGGACPAKNEFADLPVAVQRRVLQLQLRTQGLEPEFDLIERLRSVPWKVITISPELRIWREASGKVQNESLAARVSPGAPAARSEKRASPDRLKLDLEKSGAAAFAGAKIHWKIERQKTFRRPTSITGREIFTADKLGSRVILRHWRAGDRFQPIGMKQSVKLQDLFTNQKIPRAARRDLLVATTAGGEIFWVEGLRISERFKLTGGTVRRLKWFWRR